MVAHHFPGAGCHALHHRLHHGGTMGAMRNRNTMAGPQTAEIVPLHRPGEAFTDADPGGIDPLTDHEMVGLKLITRTTK